MADFTVFRTISQNDLEQQYNIDFTIHNLIEREIWTTFPIYIRRFTLDENDVDKAFGIAHEHNWHFVNIVSLFQSSVIYIDRGPLWVFPITNGILGAGRGDFSGIDIINHAEHLELDSSEFEDFRNFFQRCYDHFSKLNRNDLENYIYNAYYWLSKTRKTKLPYDRLIFLSVILESLVGAGAELTHRISHRCGVIVGENNDQRGKVYDMISDYYGKRSSLLHGTRSLLSTSELQNLTEIARSMILKFVSLSKEQVATARGDLVKKLDRAVIDDTLRNDLLAKSNSVFITRSQPRL